MKTEPPFLTFAPGLAGRILTWPKGSAGLLVMTDMDISGGFKLISKVLEANTNDLRTNCKLSEIDAGRLIEAVANACSPPLVNAFNLKQTEEQSALSIPTGCKILDNFFGKGLPRVGITEIAGESGTGKTQLALQLALNFQMRKVDGGIGKNVVYICTEGQFPVNRLQQLVSLMPGQVTYNGKSFLDNIIVEHLPDMDQLRDWVSYRLQVGIARYNIGCVIIDSIAAVFRAHEGSQKDRNSALGKIGGELRRRIAQDGLCVVVLNQVAAAIGGNYIGLVDNNVPALGLSWANFVTTRIMTLKTGFVLEDSEDSSSNESAARVRSLDLVFNPWLPRKSCPFIVTKAGVRGVDLSKESLKLAESIEFDLSQ